ncbi:MAG: 50S ribosomal protein L16 [Candidatus Paceibacterota bacterium]
MLFPKKVKHRKWQTGRKNLKKVRVSTRGLEISFGSYGLKAITSGRLTAQQIESARKAMSRNLGKVGKMWCRVFPDRPYTSKPAEVGMGKGKGDPQGYCAEVFPGRIIFEVDGVTPAIATESLRKAGTKLPVKVKVVSRE